MSSAPIRSSDTYPIPSDMRGIEKVVKKHIKKRSLMRRFINAQNDQEVVQECRDRLQHALSLFGVSPLIILHSNDSELDLTLPVAPI